MSFEQFGYHIDTFEYCRHLRGLYDITYLCLDNNLPRRELEGIDVLYCRRRPFGKAELGLLADAAATAGRLEPDVIFLRRTKYSFLLRLRYPRTPMVFDVRSGSVETAALRRSVENGLLRFNSWFFRDITVISEGLVHQLHLPRRARIVPLASDRQGQLTTAPHNELRLVYIGTFKNRHLDRTVAGLRRFLSVSGTEMPLRYTIVGFGSDEERSAILRAVQDHGLEDHVEIRDRLDHEEVTALLARNNVGVAFTPRVPWFENQPSTKIYEYLHSGLLCLATDNAANREVVSSRNGVLTGDSAEAFAEGLERILDLLPQWNPHAVADSVRENTWERVVIGTLEPLLEALGR